MAIRQHNMAADSEIGIGMSGSNGLVESTPRRHQGRRGECPVMGKFQDRLIDAFRESKIIRVDEQSTSLRGALQTDCS